MRELDARTTADVLVTTDAWGVYSHGTLALRKYMDRVRVGGAQQILLPGQIEWDRYDQAMARRMVLPQLAIESLAGLADDVEMDCAQYINFSKTGQ